MNKNLGRLLGLVAVTTLAALMSFGLQYLRVRPPTLATPLEATIAQLPLGITAEEADLRVGSAPISVTETKGVLVPPSTLYTETNERASTLGKPQTYSLRQWEQNGVKAVIAIDADGKVAGRWTWK